MELFSRVKKWWETRQAKKQEKDALARALPLTPPPKKKRGMTPAERNFHLLAHIHRSLFKEYLVASAGGRCQRQVRALQSQADRVAHTKFLAMVDIEREKYGHEINPIVTRRQLKKLRREYA